MTVDHTPEPLWINESDWLCAVEFLNDADPESRDLAADTIGYLLGYSQLTNTRSLALIGDPDLKETRDHCAAGWHVTLRER